MRKKTILIVVLFILAGLAGVLWWLTSGYTVAVLEPKGLIAGQQKSLLVFATLLSLTVIVPVYALTIGIVWKYRAANKKSTYSPDWDHNRKLEAVWWGIPCVIILILSVITWQSSHALDPSKPISSGNVPLKIQVVALQWKWLFIYPDQDIATVNYVRFPDNRSLKFEITSDAPINSFWIPQLGGQIYAMPGLKSELYLLASEPGSFRGSSANLSGTGFAGMDFTAEAVSRKNFEDWAVAIKKSGTALDSSKYSALAAPGTETQKKSYGSVGYGLYDSIIMKYTVPSIQLQGGTGRDGGTD